MRCDLCGRDDARGRRMTRTYGRGRGELLIRNVPVVACASCGETYMTATTLHEIERIKLHRRSLAETRPVDVVEFGGGRGPVKARPYPPLQRAAQARNGSLRIPPRPSPRNR